MKFYIQLLLGVNECPSNIGENRATGGAIVNLFPEFGDIQIFSFYIMQPHKTLYKT